MTDVLGSVRYWDNIIYNHLRKKNIVIPQKKENEKVEKFEGVYMSKTLKWVCTNGSCLLI